MSLDIPYENVTLFVVSMMPSRLPAMMHELCPGAVHWLWMNASFGQATVRTVLNKLVTTDWSECHSAIVLVFLYRKTSTCCPGLDPICCLVVWQAPSV
jgi:hypothetical protein